MAETLTTESPQADVEQAIYEKVAFGGPPPEVEAVEPEAVPEPEAPPPEPDFAEVEYDGDTYEVPLKLKDAIMHTADYTKKTTELSSVRKAIEAQQKEIALLAEQRKFNTEMSQHVKNAEMIDAYVKHVETNTDWSKLNTDDIVRTRVELDQLRARRTELQQFLDSSWNQFDTKMKGEREKLQKEAQETLSKSLPKWSDESKASVEGYVQALGYPEVGVQHMSALDYQVAWKAMKYDELQGNAAKVSAAVTASKTGQVVKATARKVMSTETQKYLNFRKKVAKASNSTELKKVVEDRIGEKFNRVFGGG